MLSLCCRNGKRTYRHCQWPLAEWGGNQELYAASQLYRAHIVVPRRPAKNEGDSQNPLVWRRKTHLEREREIYV